MLEDGSSRNSNKLCQSSIIDCATGAVKESNGDGKGDRVDLDVVDRYAESVSDVACGCLRI
jgi:hypothetical protein